MILKKNLRAPKIKKSTSHLRLLGLSCLAFCTPTLNHLAVADASLPELDSHFAINPAGIPYDTTVYNDHPDTVKAFLQTLDYNREESREIVARNADNIREASRVYNVPDWMIATIIYVETAQGIPGAWRWNDSASRDLFISIGRPTSMGIMQVQQNPDDIGLENHWQRMMFANAYQEDEFGQILDGTHHLQDVLRQPNRLGTSSPLTFQWSTHKLAVIAHEYNTGPSNWRNTRWDDAKPLDYGQLFVKFLPDAYRTLYGNDLSAWPLLEVPEELLVVEEPSR